MITNDQNEAGNRAGRPAKHGGVRQQLLQQFRLQARERQADDELADALEAMLWSIDDLHVAVDGWSLFRVVRESEDSLDAVGLMTLLPTRSVPIAISLRAVDRGFTWSVEVACQDPAWMSLSDSKRWNRVYLYATGEGEKPPWTWERRYRGSVP